MPLGVLFGVGDDDLLSKCPDAEWSEAGRQVRVSERAGLKSHRLERAVEHVDRAVVKVRGEKLRMLPVTADGQSLVNGLAGGVVDLQYRMGRIDAGVPGGDRPVLGRENEG